MHATFLAAMVQRAASDLPILNKMGRAKAGIHSFHGYRATHLRKNRVPEAQLRFWIGHARKSEHRPIFDGQG